MMTTAPAPSPQEPPRPPLAWGAAITGLVAFAVVSWVVLGAYVLHLPSFFAAFLLLWYWASVQKADFRKLPAAIIGALVGIGLTWAMRSLTSAFGTAGVVAGGVLIIIAILVEIMGWVRVALNPCAMLFLTVASIPPLAQAANFRETISSLLIGVAYLSLIVWLGQLLARRAQRPAAPA